MSRKKNPQTEKQIINKYLLNCIFKLLYAYINAKTKLIKWV